MTMQSNFPPDAEARLGAQEEMSTILHARLFEIKHDNATIKADIRELKDSFHAHFQETDEQFKKVDEQFQELKHDNAAIKADVQELKSSVNERFDHVYGELADLKSNMVDVRNILATLVAKLG